MIFCAMDSGSFILRFRQKKYRFFSMYIKIIQTDPKNEKKKSPYPSMSKQPFSKINLDFTGMPHLILDTGLACCSKITTNPQK